MSPNSEQPEELSDLSELNFTFESSEETATDTPALPDINEIQFGSTSADTANPRTTDANNEPSIDDIPFNGGGPPSEQPPDLPDIDSFNLQGDGDSPQPVLKTPQTVDEETAAERATAATPESAEPKSPAATKKNKKRRKKKSRKKKQLSEPDLGDMFAEMDDEKDKPPPEENKATAAETTPAATPAMATPAMEAAPTSTATAAQSQSAAAAAMAGAKTPPTVRRKKKKSGGASLPTAGILKVLGGLLLVGAIGYGVWQIDFGSFGGPNPATIFDDFQQDYQAATSGNAVDKAMWQALRDKFNAPVQAILIQYSALSDAESKAILRTTRAMIKTFAMDPSDYGLVEIAYKEFEREKANMKP